MCFTTTCGKCYSTFYIEDQYKSLKPDIVFIDINIPKIDGIELSKIISSTKVGVIFITVYDDYAVDAFELNEMRQNRKKLTKFPLKKRVRFIC
ncbi:MAG TPA: response regulator [Desulfurella acetivorans]|uniref:Response regulator n=1 Tax=Desulfurella acetivorans TaxID=33002 RepID=A0A7C6A7G2_DESAE|nr:response regulator [Desulfurella acetivorans]